MAAAYLFHIALDHPYVDGNKRTAAESADVFLFMNGYELNMSDAEFEAFVLEVATHKLDKATIARILRERSVPRV